MTHASSRPVSAQAQIEADGALCELIMYGDYGPDATAETIAETIAELLLEGASLEARPSDAQPLAFHALHGGDPLTLQAIALSGFDWRGARDAAGQSALNVFFHRRLSAADPNGEAIYEPDQPGLTLRLRHERVASRGSEALIRLGCDPNLAAPKNLPRGLSARIVCPPLHCAAIANEPGGLESLASAGADPLALDSEGLSALEAALLHGSPAFARRWGSMGLPLPSTERIEALISIARSIPAPHRDAEGVKMCAELLGALAVARDLQALIQAPAGRKGPVAL